MNVYYNGKPVIMVRVYSRSVEIQLETGARRQVPHRAVTDASGTPYEEIQMPKVTPPDVLADQALSKVGRKNLYRGSDRD